MLGTRDVVAFVATRDPTTFPGGGRVAWFKDPDGNTLSLTEEETRA